MYAATACIEEIFSTISGSQEVARICAAQRSCDVIRHWVGGWVGGWCGVVWCGVGVVLLLLLFFYFYCLWDAENAGMENAARSKLQG